MEYIHRGIENKIIESAKKMPVIGIIGPRQSGKTTLARNLFPDFLYVNLEFPDDRSFAENDPRGFLNLSKNMIIDEAQRVPELFSYIQGVVDDDKNRKYILTGSNNFLLMEKISQSLAGRIGLFTVLPFAISELKELNKKDLDKALFAGFYPRVVLENNDPTEWYQGYMQTYLERDIRQITSIHMMDQFFQFIKILATKAGAELNYSKLATDSGVSVNTIRHWTSVLRASYIIYTLPPYFLNIKKRLVKAPKIYFYDVGLLCSLLGIRNYEAINTHALAGQLFENFIMGEMVKNEFISHSNHSLFYYRDHDGLEVDIVKELDNRLDLFEIKKSKVYKKEFSENLGKLEKLFLKVYSKNVIYGGERSFTDGDVNILPWKNVK